MSSLTIKGQWDGEEEVLALLRRPFSNQVLIIRPSLPPVILDSKGKPLWFDSQGALTGAWNPQGTLLGLGREDGTVGIFAPPQTKPLVTLKSPSPWVTSLAWNPTGDRLVVAAGKTLTWWDSLGQKLGCWDQAPSTIANLHWPKTGHLAACGYGGAWIFGKMGSSPTHRLEWKGSSLKVRWAPNLKWLATGDQDRTVHLWPWPQGNDLMMGTFSAKSLSLVWSDGGEYLATSGSQSLLLWDCRGKGPGGRPPMAGPEFSGIITSIDLSKFYSTVDDEGELRVWDPMLSVVASKNIGAPGVGVCWTSENSLICARGDGKILALNFTLP